MVTGKTMEGNPLKVSVRDNGPIQRFSSNQLENYRRGGGVGEAPKVLLPIGDTIGRKIDVPTTLTVDFCAQYKLGDEIFKQLDAVELDNVGALIKSKNLASEEYHLKLGHIAEVKWALKVMLLSCPGEEVKIPPGYYKPTLIGMLQLAPTISLREN
jgi:hypothetical protein